MFIRSFTVHRYSVAPFHNIFRSIAYQYTDANIVAPYPILLLGVGLPFQYFILYTIGSNPVYVTFFKTRKTKEKERIVMRVGLQVPSFTWPNGQAQLGDTF